MQFQIPYNARKHAVTLNLLPDGYMPAHDAAHVSALAAQLTLPGDNAPSLDLIYEPGEPQELLLNVLVNLCLAEGRTGGYAWESWKDVPRESTEAIINAALGRIDAENNAIAEMEEFYTPQTDDDETDTTRSYSFRSEPDRVFWRFTLACSGIAEAHSAWRAMSRYDVEHYLILKFLRGEKPQEGDAL